MKARTTSSVSRQLTQRASQNHWRLTALLQLKTRSVSNPPYIHLYNLEWQFNLYCLLKCLYILTPGLLYTFDCFSICFHHLSSTTVLHAPLYGLSLCSQRFKATYICLSRPCQKLILTILFNIGMSSNVLKIMYDV